MIIMKVKHLPHPNFFFRKGLHKRQVFLKEKINPISLLSAAIKRQYKMLVKEKETGWTCNKKLDFKLSDYAASF